MSDSAAVDGAVFTALNDATLATYVPDGIWRDVAPAGKTRFVVVSTPAHEDVPMLQGTAFERATYLVKAVVKNTSSATANSAEARIKTLMEGITTITGYGVAGVQRTERVAYTESDPDNPDTLWQHRGGLYEVLVSPS
jgi:hypothetical protein